MSLTWIPAQTTWPPLRTAFSAAGMRLPTGGEDDRSIARLRRAVFGHARPELAEASGKIPRRLSPARVKA